MGVSNAASGRKPKPRRLKLLQGSYMPKDRPGIDVPVEVPDCPVELDDVARAEWARIVPQLEAIGLIAKVDRAALMGYCKAYSLSLVGDPSLALKALGTLRSYCAEFGLTPSSRGRMQVPRTHKPKDDCGGDLD